MSESSYEEMLGDMLPYLEGARKKLIELMHDSTLAGAMLSVHGAVLGFWGLSACESFEECYLCECLTGLKISKASLRATFPRELGHGKG